MAEILGIVSSIITIYGATVKIVSYAKRIQGAPEECQHFIRELELAQNTLSRLRVKVEREEPNCSETTKSLQEPIKNFGILIEGLGKKLGMDTTTGDFEQGGPSTANIFEDQSQKGKRTFWQNVVWPLHKQDVEASVAAIQWYISYFNLALVDNIE